VCVIGLSMHMETAVATAMKQAGASTYLAKSSGPDMLIDAIRACRSGKFV
jgi:DNA-binding NarL/FixJ family response regulator